MENMGLEVEPSPLDAQETVELTNRTAAVRRFLNHAASGAVRPWPLALLRTHAHSLSFLYTHSLSLSHLPLPHLPLPHLPLPHLPLSQLSNTRAHALMPRGFAGAIAPPCRVAGDVWARSVPQAGVHRPRHHHHGAARRARFCRLDRLWDNSVRLCHAQDSTRCRVRDLLEAMTIETNALRSRHRQSVSVFDDDVRQAVLAERSKMAATIASLEAAQADAHPAIEVGV